MELRQLRYVVTVAEERHFGLAAERLHIGQPAVSQQIRRLERELGVELFDRSPRHVRLTDAGARFVVAAREVLASADRARAAATGVRPLRLGTASGLGVRLDALLDRLALPVELDAVPVQARLDRVLAGSLDAAFVRGPVDEPRLRAVSTWRDELLVALPARHPAAGGEAVALRDLAALPLRIVERRHNPPLVDLVARACHEAGRRLDGRVRGARRRHGPAPRALPARAARPAPADVARRAPRPPHPAPRRAAGSDRRR